MKKFLMLVCMLLITNTMYAQKLYVWKPKSQQVTLRPFYQKTDTIDIVVYDGRIFNKKCIVKCTSEELVNEFYNVFNQAYGNATLVMHDATEYNQKAFPNHITIKIGIAAFSAGFGSDIQVGIGSVGGSFSYGLFPKGQWNALTALYVRVYDKRDGKNTKIQKEVSHTESKPNMFGYATAKSALNTTYLRAITEMLLIIDNSMLEE